MRQTRSLGDLIQVSEHLLPEYSRCAINQDSPLESGASVSVFKGLVTGEKNMCAAKWQGTVAQRVTRSREGL